MRGLQGAGVPIAACVKHWVADGGTVVGSGTADFAWTGAPYLPHISPYLPSSPLYLPCISPVSSLYLADFAWTGAPMTHARPFPLEPSPLEPSR